VADLISSAAVAALIQVITIDLVLAGDNALVIGLAAADLPTKQQKRAIAIGILAATALRIIGAGVATQLLEIVGLLLAGGILLLWGLLEDVARPSRAGAASAWSDEDARRSRRRARRRGRSPS